MNAHFQDVNKVVNELNKEAEKLDSKALKYDLHVLNLKLENLKKKVEELDKENTSLKKCYLSDPLTWLNDALSEECNLGSNMDYLFNEKPNLKELVMWLDNRSRRRTERAVAYLFHHWATKDKCKCNWNGAELMKYVNNYVQETRRSVLQAEAKLVLLQYDPFTMLGLVESDRNELMVRFAMNYKEAKKC